MKDTICPKSLKALLIAISLLFVLNPVLGYDAVVQHKKDSLLSVIENRSDDEKGIINAYFDVIILSHTYESQSDSALKYCNLLEKEAKKYKNLDAEAKVKSNILIILSASHRYKELIERKEDVLSFFTKHEFLDLYYEAVDEVAWAYFFLGEEEKALDYVKGEYEKAKTAGHEAGKLSMRRTIGKFYSGIGRPGDAEIWFRDILKEIKGNTQEELDLKLYTYVNLVNALLMQHNTKDTEPVLADWKKDLDMYIEQLADSAMALIPLINFYEGEMRYYRETEEYDKVIEISLFIEELSPARASRTSNLFHNRSLAYLRTGQYDKAYEENEKAIAINVKQGHEENVSVLLGFKAIIQGYLNDPKKTEQSISEYAEKMKELAKKEYTAQLDELRTTYEVDKLEDEKEIRRQQLIIAIGGCILLIIIVITYIIYSRRLKQKNQNLYYQVQELSKKEKAVEQCLLKRPDETLTKELQLFKKISEFMQAEKAFANPDLNRKALADAVATNEKYLADAIRIGSGSTFSEYIADLRLQYALDMLNNQPNLTLDAVAVDSGHGSYSQFFRSFSKKYGINPSEYRKLSSKK